MAKLVGIDILKELVISLVGTLQKITQPTLGDQRNRERAMRTQGDEDGARFHQDGAQAGALATSVDSMRPKQRYQVQFLLSRIYKVLIISQPIGIFLAVAALLVDLSNREDARVTAAWQTLGSQTESNTAKKMALEFLNKRALPFVFNTPSINMSHVRVRSDDSFDKIAFHGIDFSNADMAWAIFDRVDFIESIFDGTNLTNTNGPCH